MPSEFPTPKPVRTVSLRPDGTPIAANPSDQATSDAKPAAAPPQEAPSQPAPQASSVATGAAQPSTPKLDLPTKLSPKSAARVVVGKTDTTAPAANAETPTETAQNAAPAKPEKAAKKPKAGQVADATETTGAIAPPVDATAATTSGGWSVQLAAPKSEAEAKTKVAQLTSKYSAELNGSPDRRAQGGSPRRNDLPPARERPDEGGRRGDVRPPQGRGRAVLHRQVSGSACC